MTDPKAAIHNALRLARAVGGPTDGPSYYDQLLGKAGADAKADLTPGNKMIGNVASGMSPMAAAAMAQSGPDGGGGGGDGTAGGLGDTAGGGGYGSAPGNADSASNSPAGDGGGVMGMARGGTANEREQNLANWFGDSHPDLKDENGKPKKLYIGTLSDFSKFDRSKMNIGSDHGQGFYATSHPEDASKNYAHPEGPDHVSKLEQYIDSLRDSDEYEDSSDEELMDIARKNFGMTHKGAVMPVHITMKNPVVLGGKNETDYTFDEPYNEETDEYGEPTGTLMKLIDGVKEAGNQFGAPTDEIIDGLINHARDYGSIPASRAEKIIKDGFQHAYDDATGEMASHEAWRTALEEAGHDGIIDHTVDSKFGSNRRGFGGAKLPGMAGVLPDTTHYIAFNSNQIKSASGNQGTFDPNDPDITKAEGGYVNYARGGAIQKTMKLLQDEFPSVYMPKVGRQVMQEGGIAGLSPRQSLKDMVSGILTGIKRPQGRQAFASGGDAQGQYEPNSDQAMMDALRIAKEERDRQAAEQPVTDPMGGISMPPAQNTAQPGIYDRAMDVIGRTVGTVGEPIRAGVERYGHETYEAAQDAAKRTLESGAQSIEELKTGQYPAALSSLGWQGINAVGIPFAPVTGAWKILGEEATKVSGDPVFGSKVQFGGELLDPSHARSVFAAMNKARDILHAAQPDDIAKLAILAGPKSADPAGQAKLAQAAKMEEAGSSPKEIWETTLSAQRPYNQQWFYEIPDQGSKYDPLGYLNWHANYYGMTPEQVVATGTIAPQLDSVLWHDELYRAYPQFKTMQVAFESPAQHEKGMALIGSDYGGYYDPSTKSIVLAPGIALDPQKGRSVILHELQHAVQDIEGAPTGTNISVAKEARQYATQVVQQSEAHANERFLYNQERANNIMEEMRTFGPDYRASDRIAPMLEEAAIIKEKYPDMTDEYALATALSNNDPGYVAAMNNVHEYGTIAYATPQELYWRKSGEVEARNVQARMDMALEELRKRGPFHTQDVSRYEQIDKFPGPFGASWAKSSEPAASAAPQVERQLTPLGLYSVGRESALTLKQEKGAPQQMTAMLKSAGVKPAELENAGIIDAEGNLTPEWANRKTVTREELAEAIQKGNPEVKETVFKEPEQANYRPYEITDQFDGELPQDAKRIWEVGNPDNHAETFNIHLTNDGEYAIYDSYGNYVFSDNSFSDAVDYINNEINNMRRYGEMDQAKFAQYTLPGGTNYREVVLHTPEKIEYPEYNHLNSLPKDRYSIVFEPNNQVGRQYGVIDLMDEISFGERRPIFGWQESPEVAEVLALNEINWQNNRVSKIGIQTTPSFNESHHDVPNAIAHLRMKDREILPPENSIDAIEEKIRNANLVPTSNPKEWGSGIPELAFARDAITAEEAATYSRHRGFKNMLSNRPGVEQKVLHVDEIQSDWAQKGRDRGFEGEGVSPIKEELQKTQERINDMRKRYDNVQKDILKLYQGELEKGVKEVIAEHPNMDHLEKGLIEASISDWNVRNDEMLPGLYGRFYQKWRAMEPEQQAIYKPYIDELTSLNSRIAYQSQQADQLRSSIDNLIPKGPYVQKTEQWVDLALKRALNEAAKGNYNKIAFTQGLDQADRYGLHKQLKKIHFLPDDNGKWHVGAELPSGREFDRASGLMDEKQITEMFGKDIADKVKAGEFSGTENNVPYIEGDDLRAGGKGMLKFYDEIVPKRTRELLKKLDKDAQVKTEFIATSGEPWPFTINIAHDGDKYWLTSMDPRQSDARKHTISPKYNSYEEADKIRQGFMEGRTTPVYTVEMTPKLKEAIGKGLPAYKRGGSVVDKALMVASKYA